MPLTRNPFFRLLIVITFFYATINLAPAAPSSNDANKSFALAEKEFIGKRYAEAEKLARRAISENKSTHGSKIQLIKTYNLLIAIYYAENRLSDASQVFAELMPILKVQYGAHEPEYAQALKNYLTLLKQLGNDREAKKLQDEVKAIEDPGLTYGYVNKKGAICISWPVKFYQFNNCYHLPGPFSEGLAAVYQGDEKGRVSYINREGQVVVAPRWHRGLPFHDGLAQVYELSSVSLINKQGAVIVPARHDFFPTQRSEGLWPVSGGGAYLDDTGKTALSLPYSGLRSFHEGLAGVAGKRKDSDVNESWGFINKESKLVIDLQYWKAKDFSEGFAPVQIFHETGERRFRKDWAYINRSGMQITDAKYQWADMFSQGLACVGDGESPLWTMRYGFIDKTGKEVIPLKFDWAESFSEGLALVHCPKAGGRYEHVFINGKSGLISKNGNWAFIDKTGKIVITLPSNCEEVYSFSEGLARVKLGGLYGFIDKTGQLAIKAQFRYAGDFSEGLSGVLVW